MCQYVLSGVLSLSLCGSMWLCVAPCSVFDWWPSRKHCLRAKGRSRTVPACNIAKMRMRYLT